MTELPQVDLSSVDTTSKDWRYWKAVAYGVSELRKKDKQLEREKLQFEVDERDQYLIEEKNKHDFKDEVDHKLAVEKT